MTNVIYQDHRKGNLPKLDATEFIKFIESHDPKL